MDDVSLSSVGRLFQMTAADTANALAPMTVLVRCAESFVVWCRPSADDVDRLLQRPRCSHLPSMTWQDRAGTWRRSWVAWTVFAARCGASLACAVPLWCGQTFLCRSQRALLNSVLSGASSADHRRCAIYSTCLKKNVHHSSVRITPWKINRF